MDRQIKQTTMAGAFQDADGAAVFEQRLFASRLRQLLMAAKECGDDSLKCLCEFTYRKTRRGLGSAWRYESLWPDVGAGPFGLCCGRDKAYRLARIASKAKLIIWDKEGQTLRINWNGVFGRRRLPVPRQLLSAGDTSGTGTTGHQVTIGESRKSSQDSIPRDGKPFRNTESHSARRNEDRKSHYISARARSVKSMTDDDEILSVVKSLPGEEVAAKAWTVWRKLHGHVSAPSKIDPDSADLILGGLALSRIDREWGDWFRWSVRKSGKARKHNAGGHFHATLANNLWDRLGLDGIDEDNCRAELNSLLRLVRPVTSTWRILAPPAVSSSPDAAEPSPSEPADPQLVEQWNRELERSLSARRASLQRVEVEK